MAGAAPYSSSIIHESENDSNQQVLTLIWRSGLRSWKKRFVQFKIKVRNGAYPVHLESLWVIMGFLLLAHFSATKVPFELVRKLLWMTPR